MKTDTETLVEVINVLNNFNISINLVQEMGQVRVEMSDKYDTFQEAFVISFNGDIFIECLPERPWRKISTRQLYENISYFYRNNY